MKSPYTKDIKTASRHTVAIPEDVMVLVDRWAEEERKDGRKIRSRNDAVNRIVRLATEKFSQTKKENGTK